MSRDKSRDRQYREYGQSWEIAAALSDGPRTLSEIMDHFHDYLRAVGFFRFGERLKRLHKQLEQSTIEQTLGNLITRGWVVRDGGRYVLTPLGREEAEKPLADMRRTRALLQKLAQPQTVSKVGLVVHLGLATLKLPAGFLSGSVGLLNDGLDTLLDGLSSLLVYFGFRFNRERSVNVVLLLFMLGTGGLTLYQAVQRFFVPFEPTVDWFAFLAAAISALICSVLWAYQRYVGLRSGSLALITQSVDSRNHVIVAASVTVGLIASLLRFPLLDTLVGLTVAVLILKSAVDLAIELIRSLSHEEVDLSRYRFRIVSKYNQFRQAQLRDWMLYLVEEQRAETRTELIAQAHQALDFGKNPMLRELGLEKLSQASAMIEQSMANLFDRGWLIEEEQLSVTDTGKDHLRQGMSEKRR